MKKQLTTLILLLALGLALAPGALARPRVFWDVQRGDWFAPYVYALADAGIIDGMEPERYAPADEVTRAQLVKLMTAAAAEPEALEAARENTVFSDVHAGDWHAPYIHFGAERGLAAGYPDGTFRPDASVTRAEAALFVTRFAALGGAALRTGDAPAFTDAGDIPDWAAEAVEQCARGGVFQGYADGSFRPGAPMTRAETAAILCRLLGQEPVAADALPDAKQPGHICTSVDGTSVEAIVLAPHGYTGAILLAQDRLFGSERADAMLARAGAYLGANGAFFDLLDRTTYADLVLDGVPVRIDNTAPVTPSLVLAADGTARIEWMKAEQTLTRLHDGEAAVTAAQTARNRVPYDPDGGTPETVLYTAAFGATVPAGFARAALCAPDGTVLSCFDGGAEDIPIPEEGFIVAEHGAGAQLLANCAAGDVISVGVWYDGAQAQDIRAALSCGPSLVRGGIVCADADRFAAEGYHAADIVTLSAPRLAVGIRPDGSMVFAHAVCTMTELAGIMAALGCESAMNLDGGSSCCLRAGETVVCAPGRAMNTMIVFSID